MTAIEAPLAGFGELLRGWRQHRRLSQLELSTRAAASTRHLSFLENGRARPSREMVLHLAEELDVPLRERNRLLVAAGFAPVYRETDLGADELSVARAAIDRVLAAQDPFPAVVVNRWWDLVAANPGTSVFLELLPESLLAPPANVVRASLHPDGLASHIVNFDEYASHLLGRVRRNAELTGDPVLAELATEVAEYPCVAEVLASGPAGPGVDARRWARSPETKPSTWGGALLPLRLATTRGELSFFSTIATFGTPNDITLDELSIEMFFPADEATALSLGDRGLGTER